METTNLRQKVDFTNKNIFVGADVHKKNWNISLYLEQQYLKTFSQPASCEALAGYLKREYPKANYLCGYESGYCGFTIQRKLESLGIRCVVLHAADIPQTSKEKTNKNDRNDSKKIGKCLTANLYNKVYVPDPEAEADRNLVRIRHSIQNDIVRCKNRIKGFLLLNGIEIPEQFNKSWSKKFIEWLRTFKELEGSARMRLDLMIDELENIRIVLLKANRNLRQLQKSQKYEALMKTVTSVPGFGPLIGITLITEIIDIKRFSSIRKLRSFIGIIPSEFSSGEKERKGDMTNRHNRNLRYLIIEAAWTAIRIDPALSLAYNEWTKRMTAKRAIVKIAKKLISRLYHIWLHETKYENGVLK